MENIIFTLDKFGITIDFYQAFPQLEIAFYPTPSKVMGAIALDVHPESVYRKMDRVSRRALIKENYLKEGIDGEAYEDQIKLFLDLCLSKKKRFLVLGENDFEERQEFLASIKYHIDTPTHLLELKEKWSKDTDRMWKQYLTCLKAVEDENQYQTKAGSLESASESNII